MTTTTTQDHKNPTEREAYIKFRGFFSNKGREKFRKRKTIEQALEEPEIKPTVEQFCTEYGLQPDILADTLRTLLTDRVFEDLSSAKIKFPEIFQQSLNELEEKERWESEAAKSEAAMIAEYSRERDQVHNFDPPPEIKLPINKKKRQRSSTFDPAPSVASHPNEIENLDDPVAKKVKAVLNDGMPQIPSTQDQKTAELSLEEVAKPKIPNIFPVYLPYHVQNFILTEAQAILEESCFYFVRKWLPKRAVTRQFEHPKNAELNMWIRLIRDKIKVNKIPSEAMDQSLLASIKLKKTLDVLESLRHTVVHRLDTHSKGIENMLQHSITFGRILKDHERVFQLEKLMDIANEHSLYLESMKFLLRSGLEKELMEIEKARRQLAERERQAISKMLDDDRKASLEIKLSPYSIWETLGITNARMYGKDYVTEFQDEAHGDEPNSADYASSDVEYESLDAIDEVSEGSPEPATRKPEFKPSVKPTSLPSEAVLLGSTVSLRPVAKKIRSNSGSASGAKDRFSVSRTILGIYVDDAEASVTPKLDKEADAIMSDANEVARKEMV
ncbi:hypothetical protein H072_351 [Dactylellina haptotyla CBS 200.50]|uniref:Uncharacterized protein n=1 Tax=Dactylellina haptotyla (strain CBS 200.50) TaxID=1284197 RepID=S8AXD1_DACHA|nr:hypothetical protein H072_351 [Dactylellina haptotyla CBS 200.50]